MSLQQARYALNASDDPLEKGMAAGQSAYRGITSSVMGDLQKSSQQRNVLGLNAQAQRDGAYPVSGTSAAAYQYLHGAGPYPYAPSNQGPTSIDYEKAHGITGSRSQASLAQEAKDAPWRGASSSDVPDGSKVKPPKGSLLDLALPAYLAYSLWPSGAGAAGAGAAGAGAAGAASPYAATQTGTFLPTLEATTPYELGAAAEGTSTATFLPNATAGTAGAEAGGLEVLGEASGNWAPSAGYVYNPATGAMEAATTAEVAAAATPSAAGATTLGVDGVITAEGAGAAGAAGGSELAAMASTYGPYIAAAIIADQLLLDGQLSSALGDVVGGIGDALGDVVSGVGDVVGGIGDVVGDVVGGVGDVFGGVVDAGGDLIEDAGDFLGDLGGGCFITTAAVEHMGNPDDGRVLTAFRQFRDGYMMKSPERRREVEWYYRKAPKIVAAINKNPKENEIYRDMYRDYIIPTYKAIKTGDMEHAHQEYTKMIGFAKKASGLSEKELTMGPSKGIPKNISKNFKGGGKTEDDWLKPEVEPTNKFGQLLDSIVENKYNLATKTGDTATANKFKEELAYRKRMKERQQTFADGGVSGSGNLDLHIPLSVGDQQQGVSSSSGTAFPSGYPFTESPQQNAKTFNGFQYTPGSAEPQGFNPMAASTSGAPLTTGLFSGWPTDSTMADTFNSQQQAQGMAIYGYGSNGQGQMISMADGGISGAAYNLGGYSDGGRLLRGPGDGVSDSIPATIGKKRQPARLADGEFVVPARIVSELGNGSTEAGARKLYAMMDRIQAGRKKSVGKGKVAVNSRADKYLPA